MTPVWKETLIPGAVIDPKTGERYTITPRLVQQAHRNVKKMLARGVPIPLLFEHCDFEAGDPNTRRAAYARHCFGHVGACRVSASGALELRHDVANDDDIRRLRACKFVSPKIRPNGWMDSRGHEYTGAVLTHSALTASPVQYWQKPFELSDSGALCLSYAPPDDELDGAENDPKCPLYSETFTEWLDALDLSTTEPEEVPAVADDNDKKPKVGAESEGGEGGNADLKAIVKALKERFSAKISDKVSNWGELLIAIESNGEAMPEEEVDNGNPDDDLPGAADDTTTGAGAPPMVMSTLDANPVRRKRAQKEAVTERTEAVKRINAAFESGRIDGPKKRALTRVATDDAVEMSFTATGEAGGKKWGAFLTDLAAVEAKPANSAWKPTGKRDANGVELSTTGVDLPNLGAAPKPERVQAGVDVILGKKSVNEV